MIALTIIALVLSLAAVAVGLVLIFRISALFGEVGDFEKDINNEITGLKQAVKDMEGKDVVIEGIPGLSYDEKTNSVKVGNLWAEGWIASGTKKED